MKSNYLSLIKTKRIEILRIIIIALASIAILAEFLPEVKAKPIVITALVATISLLIFEFKDKKERNT
jgi:hypothetical protein